MFDFCHKRRIIVINTLRIGPRRWKSISVKSVTPPHYLELACLWKQPYLNSKTSSWPLKAAIKVWTQTLTQFFSFSVYDVVINAQLRLSCSGSSSPVREHPSASWDTSHRGVWSHLAHVAAGHRPLSDRLYQDPETCLQQRGEETQVTTGRRKAVNTKMLWEGMNLRKEKKRRGKVEVRKGRKRRRTSREGRN